MISVYFELLLLTDWLNILNCKFADENTQFAYFIINSNVEIVLFIRKTFARAKVPGEGGLMSISYNIIERIGIIMAFGKGNRWWIIILLTEPVFPTLFILACVSGRFMKHIVCGCVCVCSVTKWMWIWNAQSNIWDLWEWFGNVWNL